MAEKLELTTSEVSSLNDWRIVRLFLDQDLPSIVMTVKSNTGIIKIIRYLPDFEDPSLEVTIRAGLSFINKGKFKTVEGKSLQKWSLERLRNDGHLGAGNIVGSPE